MVQLLLPGIARQSGMPPIGLSAMAAAQFVSNFLGVFGGRVPFRTVAQIAVMRALGPAALISVPFLEPVWWIPSIFMVWMTVALLSPVQLRIWGVIYPPSLRGRLSGLVKTGFAVAGAGIAIAGGLLADRFGGPVVVGAAGAVAALGGLAYAAIKVPSHIDTGWRSYSARDAMQTLIRHPLMSALIIAQTLYGAGAIAATPLYPLIQIDRLQLSLTEIGFLGIVQFGMLSLSYLVWGTLADRVRPTIILMLGALFGTGMPFFYTIADSYPFLIAAAVCQGLSSSALDMGITASYSRVPLTDRAKMAASWTSLTGFRGAIVPFLSGILVQSNLLTVTQALVVCTAVSATGILYYLWIVVRPPADAPLATTSAA